MVATIIRDKSLADDKPCISFTVYTLPDNGAAVCGFGIYTSMIANGPWGFWQTEFGIPVGTAFRQTKAYAKSNGIPFIIVFDPDKLFFDERPAEERFRQASGSHEHAYRNEPADQVLAWHAMSPDDFDVHAAARVVIRRHGDDAVLFVAARLADLLGIGDVDGQTYWLRILAAVRQLQRNRPREGETVH